MLCFYSGALNKNSLEQFFRGLRNENIRKNIINQVDDLRFETSVALHKAEIQISEFKI